MSATRKLRKLFTLAQRLVRLDAAVDVSGVGQEIGFAFHPPGATSPPDSWRGKPPLVKSPTKRRLSGSSARGRGGQAGSPRGPCPPRRWGCARSCTRGGFHGLCSSVKLTNSRLARKYSRIKLRIDHVKQSVINRTGAAKIAACASMDSNQT